MGMYDFNGKCSIRGRQSQSAEEVDGVKTWKESSHSLDRRLCSQGISTLKRSNARRAEAHVQNVAFMEKRRFRQRQRMGLCVQGREFFTQFVRAAVVTSA